MNDGDELYDEIYTEIERKLKSDKQIQSIQKKIDKGTATHVETQTYAKRLGEITSKALLNNLGESDLPDGNLSYGVAKKAVGKTLKDNLVRVNGVGKEIQLDMNIAAGLGIMAMGAKLNADRIDGLVSAMDDCTLLEDARELMGEPIINTTQSYADDLVKENADAQYELGLKSVVVRTANEGCCEWCAELEGTYDYDDVRYTGADVYRRHEYCRCIVTFHPDDRKSYTNVHTQREYRDALGMSQRQERIKERLNYGL